MPIEIGKRFVRVRIRSPKVFRRGTFKTHDIGRKGHSLRVAGIRKKTGKFATQSYLILKSDLKKLDPRALNIVRAIKQKHGITVNLKRLA